jgi:ankyrin repeat protein
MNHKDNRQWSALHYACYYAHEDTLRALLSTHVSVDEANPPQFAPELTVTERTAEGYTPLNLLLALPPSHITKAFVIKLIKKVSKFYNYCVLLIVINIAKAFQKNIAYFI